MKSKHFCKHRLGWHIAANCEIPSDCLYSWSRCIIRTILVCVCACLSFWQGTANLGICHVFPAGCRSHVGADRWTEFSFPVVYNSDRQRREQRARKTEHYRGKCIHWNREENLLKKGTLQLQSFEDTKKLEAPRDKPSPVQWSRWKKYRNRLLFPIWWWWRNCWKTLPRFKWLQIQL